MEVLQLTTVVDVSGHLHLNISTQLALGQVNIVLVLNPVLTPKTQKPNYDFSDLAGNLSWQGDAIATCEVIPTTVDCSTQTDFPP